MNYYGTRSEIKVGDPVLVEGGSPGTVICDIDAGLCLPGYERLLPTLGDPSGDYPRAGIIVDARDFGFIHYAEEDEDIVPFKSDRA